MTTYNRTSLKTFFETGDVPGGADYANLIDSCLNIVETGVQTMGGALNPTELITPRVSAGTGVFTGNLRVDGALSAASISLSDVSISSLAATGNISASAASVYASAGRFSSGLFQGTGVVSALGSAQADAAPLTYIINIGAGVADGVTTGFMIRNNRAGHIQYIVNGGASANLWPATECKINALSTNAAFGMAANTLYTIIHTTNSAYAVK